MRGLLGIAARDVVMLMRKELSPDGVAMACAARDARMHFLHGLPFDICISCMGSHSTYAFPVWAPVRPCCASRDRVCRYGASVEDARVPPRAGCVRPSPRTPPPPAIPETHFPYTCRRYVRGVTCPGSGMLLSPVPGRPGVTRVVNVVHADPAGWLPPALVNRAMGFAFADLAPRLEAAVRARLAGTLIVPQE